MSFESAKTSFHQPRLSSSFFSCPINSGLIERLKLLIIAILFPQLLICNGLDLIHRSMSDFALHPTGGIIGEADSILSRTRAALAPAKPVLRILDRVDP